MMMVDSTYENITEKTPEELRKEVQQREVKKQKITISTR